MTRRLLLAIAVLSLACGGDGQAPEPAPSTITFDTVRLRLLTTTDTLPLVVELAESEAQRAQGLMGRDSIPEDHGMLFLFDRPRDPDEGGFYMWRTRVPLDIAFLDASGRIVAIRSMEPCPNPYPARCPTYAPDVSYSAAIEVPAGWFARRGVAVGDRVSDLEAMAPE